MYFCISCITGKEEQARDSITRFLSDKTEEEFTVWFPTKINKDKKQGVYTEQSHPLFPGYLFAYWEGENERDFPFYEVERIPQVIRFMRYDNGSRALLGDDFRYASWIHENRGEIKPSKVFYKEGTRLKIISGPLRGFDGQVVKVDRHHSRISVRFTVGQVTTDVSFSVDFIREGASNI
ncbi:MAG: KOW motif-containing protein [Sphaerochaetaceae bacterium]|nr:KOW motif-containing protein [Sphaerochaetaceae bacterium]